MKLAFIYGGQGAQKAQMGLDLYNSFETFKNTFDMVDSKGELKRLCFESPIEELSLTENTQPCMVAFAIGVSEVLKDNKIVPDMTAGLSLGEYCSLYLAGAMDAKQAVDLVAFRGKIMSEALVGVESSMYAILALDRELVKQACDEAKSLGVVEVANYNCPGQIVIGGESAACEKASEIALSLGAKRAIKLNVSGAFHTPLMRDCSLKLAKRLETEDFKPLQIPVIFNSTAKTLQSDQTIAELLEKQIYTSVYFEDSIKFMIENGIDTFVEIGPSSVLAAFVKKISKEVKIYNIENKDSLENVIAELSAVL